MTTSSISSTHIGGRRLLSVGQIFLLDNPLLREPLKPEHVKPRLLGHFGTVPGLNLIYAHMNPAYCSATSVPCT